MNQENLNNLQDSGQNLLNKFLSWSTEFTDCPKEFLLHSFFAIVGSLIGRKRWVEYGVENVYPNLWVCLVGKSSMYHKSTAIRIVIDRLLRKVAPENISSADNISRFLEEIEVQPESILVYNEILYLMSLNQKDYLKTILTELWDNPDIYEKSFYNFSVSIKKPCISILSASTSSWLAMRIREKDVLGGFIPRFIFVVAENKDRKYYFPTTPNKDIEREIIQMLLQIKSIQPKSMGIETEAMKLYEAFYEYSENLVKVLPSKVHPFFSKIVQYLLKYAIVIETVKTLGKSTIISNETMCEAVEIMKNIVKSTTKFVDAEIYYSRSEEMINRIYKKMVEYKDKFDNKFKKGDIRLITSTTSKLSEYLDILVSMGKVKKEKVSPKMVVIIDGQQKIKQNGAPYYVYSVIETEDEKEQYNGSKL